MAGRVTIKSIPFISRILLLADRPLVYYKIVQQLMLLRQKTEELIVMEQHQQIDKRDT